MDYRTLRLKEPGYGFEREPYNAPLGSAEGRNVVKVNVWLRSFLNFLDESFK